MKIHIFVLASLPGTLARIKSYLRGRKSIVVSGFSMDPADALKYMSENPQHMLLIDDAFYNRNDIFWFFKMLTPPRVYERTIIYTGANDYEYINQLVNIGITAIVHNRSPKTNIIEALKLVNMGGSYIDSYFNLQIFKNRFKSNQTEGEEESMTVKSLSLNLN